MNLYIEIFEVENQATQLTRSVSDHTWVFFILLLLVSLFIYGRNNYSKSFQKLISAAFNENSIKEILRDQHLLVKRAIIIFNLIFILSIGLVLYHLIKYYDINFENLGMVRYGIIISILAALYFIQYGALKIFAFIFKLNEVIDEYIVNLIVVNGLLGIFCIPLSILMEYASKEYLSLIIKITCCVLLVILSYRYLRGFYLARRYIVFYRVYFFLYLCTFEIFPWLFLYKIFILSPNI